MNPFLSKILIDVAKKRLADKKTNKIPNDREVIPYAEKLQVELFHAIKDYFLIIVGVFAAGFGLKGFLLPNNFIDGGVTGMSLLIKNLTDIDLGILLVIVNIPFLLLGARTFSIKFAVKSAIAITFLALVVHFIEYPIVTDDKLLIAIFGGFFLGLGIGMAMRGGSVIDGTEVLAVFLSRKFSLTVGDVLLIINIVIFSFGAYVLSVEIALYAILTYLSAAKTVDFVVDGVEEYVGVTIISDHHEEIRQMITQKLRRACTIFLGKSGVNTERTSYKNIIYLVVTRLELSRLQTEIDKIDSKAFTVMGVVKDLKGGMIKKKALK